MRRETCRNGHKLVEDGTQVNGRCKRCARDSSKKYRESEKGKVATKRAIKNWSATEKGKESIRRSARKWNASEGSRAAARRYRSSEKGRIGKLNAFGRSKNYPNQVIADAQFFALLNEYEGRGANYSEELPVESEFEQL